MNRAIELFHHYRPLINELIVRDLKVKYRTSFLGYIWSLLNPLLMIAVMTVVFSNMFRFDIPNFPLYLICGQTLWSFFNESSIMDLLNCGNLLMFRQEYFSSGMVARLGFAFATEATAEPLIVDEVVAVGDYAFQQKCIDRTNQLLQGKTTLFLRHMT